MLRQVQDWSCKFPNNVWRYSAVSLSGTSKKQQVNTVMLEAVLQQHNMLYVCNMADVANYFAKS